ncbi:MAG: polysaccharide biosynthesis protein [Oscillospiraceae bacterium]|nr:polysaccharide biosynthesis protein [Oscillospiraceae bacterium]
MKSLKLLFALIDVMFTAISLFAAAMLRYDGVIDPDCVGALWTAFPFAAGTLLLLALLLGCNDCILSYAGFSEMIRQLITVMGVTFVLYAVKLFGMLSIPHSVIIINGILLYILTGGMRLFFRFYRWVTVSFGLGRRQTKRVLVIGAGAGGAMIIKRWRSNEKDNQFPVAVLDDDLQKQGKRICGVKIRGTSADLEEVVHSSGAEAILIAIPSANLNTIKRLYHLALPTGLPVTFFQSVVNLQNVLGRGTGELMQVPVEELIRRGSNQMDVSAARQLIQGRVVLVTGGAGSIGSELCRQIMRMECERLIIFDLDENAMFQLNEELKRAYSPGRYQLVVGSVCDTGMLEYIFARWSPQLVFHAAAHKHVPMMEGNIIEAIQNNVIGTRNVIRASKKHKALKFVLISTDKAVKPANTMGATKRLCELMLQSEANSKTTMAAVRFGNVIGSNGSVVPLFQKQIAQGGPVTVTDPEITRYFMTIPEAVSLVLTAAHMAQSREIFVLDMGKPVRIYDLACNLIRSAGLMPNRDIDIVFTGLRPGEKMYEELHLDSEGLDQTENQRIMRLKPGKLNEIKLRSDVDSLETAIRDYANEKQAYELLFQAIQNEEQEYAGITGCKKALVH